VPGKRSLIDSSQDRQTVCELVRAQLSDQTDAARTARPLGAQAGNLPGLWPCPKKA